MKLLILSDSHGAVNALCEAVARHPEAEHVFFLGDGARDTEELTLLYPRHRFYFVRGNCDWSAPHLQDEGIAETGGVRVWYTHGHIYDVKKGRDRLLAAALERKAALCLYGHTHFACVTEECGVTFVNPGSIGYGGTYALAEISPAGIKATVEHL